MPARKTNPGPKDGHVHLVFLDKANNGLTSEDGTNKHRHRVQAGNVLEADGHTHVIVRREARGF